MSLWEQTVARTWPIWTTVWQHLCKRSLKIAIYLIYNLWVSWFYIVINDTQGVTSLEINSLSVLPILNLCDLIDPFVGPVWLPVACLAGFT